MSTQHAPASFPASGTGYQVCACGATRRVENGVPRGDWHTCSLCTHPNFHKESDQCPASAQSSERR